MATVAQDVQKLFIAGEWVETSDTIVVRSPYDGKVVGEVAWGNKDHARNAIDAAAHAMAKPIPTHRRAEILENVAHAMKREEQQFARTIASEAGKPISLALIEVERGYQTLLFSATAARQLHGEVLNLDAHPAGEGKIGMVLRVPIGIVAAITPFNFPLNLVTHKVGPAIAAGCAVVLKPADKTPMTAFLLAKLFEEAGLPAGWLNVVLGPPEEIASVILKDDRVKALSFTGSAEIGWKLRAQAPKKKVMLELGNSTPLIVMADGDLDEAAKVAADHGFGFSGQACIAVQRIYVQDAAYDRFLEKLLAKVKALKVGDPMDPDTEVGPLITHAGRDRILSWIKEAEKQGARVMIGGQIDGSGILHPTVLTNVSENMAVSCKEVFGPVVTVSRISSLEEAIELANGTPYGLQAGIFTANFSAAMQAAARLEFGGVTINVSPTFRVDQMPYGGTKESGNTREGPAYTVEELTERRVVVCNMR